MLLCGGCATTTVNRAKIDSVDRIAIIGFQGVYDVKDPDERKKGTFARIANAASDIARDASGDEDEQLREALNYSYDELGRVVGNATGLEFLPRQTVADNAWYRSELGARGKTPGFDLSTADGVIGQPLLLNLTESEREAFMSNLGVDAVALARIIWLTGSTQESGIAGYMPGGKRIRPLANIQFVAWQRGSPDPIWSESGVRGCPTVEGIEDAGGISVTPDMAPILMKASDLGYAALIARYHEARESADGSVGITTSSLTGGVSCP